MRPAAKKTTRLDTLLLGACCMFAKHSQGTHSLLLALLLFLPFVVSGYAPVTVVASEISSFPV